MKSNSILRIFIAAWIIISLFHLALSVSVGIEANKELLEKRVAERHANRN